MKKIRSLATLSVMVIILSISLSRCAPNSSGLGEEGMEEAIHTETITNSPIPSESPEPTGETLYNKTTPPIPTSDIKEKTGNERSYDSPFDFPYDDMEFVNEGIFEVIKDAYSKIDFYGEFKKGDVELYDYYKNKYLQLLKNEVVFVDEESEEEYLLNEFGELKVYDDVYDWNDYNFHFFDMDEDGAPEFCITDDSFTYIFKYVTDMDKFILWRDMGLWDRLNGSRKVRWNREGIRHVFYKLDKEGEEEITVFFFERSDFNKKTGHSETVYMLALPKYENKDDEVEITKGIKRQGYYDEGYEVYYFRVTEKQYNKITKNYNKAEKLARKNIKEVTFTYDELFGTVNQ